jgi:formiminotetrahydrofolate cyclodeaminase
LASSDLLAAGPATAATLVLAAGLAELTARVATNVVLAERARELREQAAPLGTEDAAAYEDLLRTQSDEAQALTVELPLRMAELAAEIAEVCALAAGSTRGPARGDAAAGAELAAAAGRAAARLVAINVQADDHRVRRARLLAERADEAASGIVD